MLLAFLQFGTDLMEEFSKLAQECLTFPRNIKKVVHKLSYSSLLPYHTLLPLLRSPFPAAMLSQCSVLSVVSEAFDSGGYILFQNFGVSAVRVDEHIPSSLPPETTGFWNQVGFI